MGLNPNSVMEVRPTHIFILKHHPKFSIKRITMTSSLGLIHHVEVQSQKMNEIGGGGNGGRTSGKRGNKYRQLSDAKYKEKLQKRLCFRCDEKKYGPGHRCKSKQLQVLVVETEDRGEDDLLTVEELNFGEVEGNLMVLSLNSVGGL